VILLLTGALGVIARRALLLLASAAFAKNLKKSLRPSSYRHSRTPEHISQQELLQQRNASDEWHITEGRKLFGRLLERTKAEYDLYNAGGQKQPPVVDILIISGGGDRGAFGAGFLKGWQKVPGQHPLAKPEFDAVTGVSTGTLIAPFAFVGDAKPIDQIANLYRNPEQDWVKHNGLLYFLPDNISFAEVPGLERKLREHITLEMVRRIAKAGDDGRLLLVNTTNLLTTPRRGCSTSWKRPGALPTRASSSAFITSCSPRLATPARFRSG